MKTCSKCSRSLPLTEFQRCSRNKDGRRAECKECKNAALRRHRAQNPEHVRARDRVTDSLRVRRLTADQRRRRIAMVRAWRARNPERSREAVRRWRKANPWFQRVKSSRRYARQRFGTGRGTLRPSDVRAKLQQQAYRCACCAADLLAVGHHIDHVVALANGGAHEPSNIQMLCPTCNQRKGAMCPIAFRQLIEAEQRTGAT